MRNSRKILLCFFMASAVLLVPGVVTAQRTNVARDYPIYDNGGKPDIVIDPQRFTAQMEIVDRYFEPTDCAIPEQAVGGAGYRRLLRFDTGISFAAFWGELCGLVFLRRAFRWC